MKNNTLKYYILGFITGFIAIPVIEELMNVVNTWIQVLIIKPSKIVLKGNNELAEMQNEDEPQPDPFCIGFQAPDEYEYDDEDDDYQERVKYHVPFQFMSVKI